MEKQLTADARGHQLTNINVWTPDSQWLVYDVRPHGGSFTGSTIERVNVETGEVQVLYQAPDGAHVGVVTVSPDLPARYAFIHGPENPDESWQYDFHHRRGVIVSEPAREKAVTLDAMDITAPFTAGALRGGTHVHVFSPDGSRLSFTYNDHVLHQHDPALDLRNVGVALSGYPVVSPKHHPREYDGSHFSILVSETTPYPHPGSDEINRAYEEGWVGREGYLKPDGRRQRWALAFIGDTLSVRGEKHPEIFVVDLPHNDKDYRQAGDNPLQGTPELLPAPPAGVKQRRITFTENGIALQPRHWLRASPDGAQIAFLMKDRSGVVQVWTVSPNGGEPVQISHSGQGIQSAFSWSPDGKSLALVCDNSVMRLDWESGKMQRLTQRSEIAPCADAVVYSPDGSKVAFMRQCEGYSQICVADSH
ncbi:YidR family protein [Rahnella aquatilis CIP 78.65 = ATCC 33071]|uniref:Periplasmic component of the Tol biopolymer transport system n=1 Tax=Rahnella aquatilis (strain ATCC 33071 / DSM 4594 / JCM 1683 / NBRC 105701 / NCIMB 13365 / CIP 78.65) TaxID=745277 RepID=H2IZQ2_RAHAC|nr:DUF3748 domain-containing protein [Rahnella aquatilis]AEX49961.1 periplasmic component of the Tol biopolymer transport system [Rahnella aquatilis CIP 78.65 = ATCC 33071]KFD00626.1 YidR family protein [Rahnella aquatilis CIP 78.65 = ATCC 33071]